MALTPLIRGLLSAASANAIVMPMAIIVGTFILEDASTIIAGVLASKGAVDMTVALTSLYAGVILGDLGLYGVGRLALNHRWARRFADLEKVQPLREKLTDRVMFTVFAVRFLPGLRLPMYTASGFFCLPFGRFAVAVVAATLVWTSLLFGASFAFGAATAQTLGHWCWAGVTIAILALFLLAYSNSHGRRRASARRTPSR